MYCLTAAWVGGMSSSVLPLCAKSCFLASFISIVSLVLSCMSTTNLSSHDIDSLLTAEGSRSSSMNAPVTSRKALHVAHAVFFPLPEKDTVSHPVKAWKMERLLQYLESILAISSWIAMFRKCDPVPRITHSSSGLILSNEATASTYKSVSTVRMLTLL